MDVIRIDGDFCPADVRVVELVDSLHSQVASIEAENAKLRERIKALEAYLKDVFVIWNETMDNNEMSEKLEATMLMIDAALAGGKEE